MTWHVVTRMLWGDGGGLVRTAAFSALTAVLLVGASVSAWGRAGLTVGLLVFGLVSLVLTGLVAKGERRGSA